MEKVTHDNIIAGFIKKVGAIDWLMAAVVTILGGVLLLCVPISAQGYALAGTVAIMIAFVAYPWQKELDRAADRHEKRLDRQTDFLSEQRVGLQGFILEWSAIKQDMLELRLQTKSIEDFERFSDRFSKIDAKCEDNQFRYILNCPSSDAELATEMTKALRKVWGEVTKNVSELSKSENPDSVTEQDVELIFKDAIVAWEDKYYELLSRLVNHYRSSQPFLDNSLQVEIKSRRLEEEI